MQIKTKNKPGFTMVELTVVLGIISVLVIIIALLIAGIIQSYTKGITIKAVNATGRDIIEDISTSISNSPNRDIKDLCTAIFSGNSSAYNACTSDNAYRLVYSARYSGNKPISGSFCTGRYSYIWNTGYAEKTNGTSTDSSSAVVRYNVPDATEVEITDFRLLKILDQSNIACLSRTKALNNDYSAISDQSNTYDLTRNNMGYVYTLQEAPIELLAQSDSDLILYDLEVFRPAQDYPSFHAFYTGSFVLGTVRGGVNILSAGDFCKPPADYQSDFDYCSVNKFNFASQTLGG